MESLNTIQKREKLNEVVILDEKGPGGANHRYEIVALQPNSKGIGNMLSLIHI
ncbi:MAG: ABC transporter ATPase, partial [Clostridium perfringens]|nr:ABC transporter ATPase [Clostridium perfringens]